MACKDVETLYVLCMKKHVLFAFCSNNSSVIWPFYHGDPVPDLLKMYVPLGHGPAVLWQVWDRRWAALERTQTWTSKASEDIWSTACLNHMTDRVCHFWSGVWCSGDLDDIYWVIVHSLSPGISSRPVCLQVRKAACFRKQPAFRRKPQHLGSPSASPWAPVSLAAHNSFLPGISCNEDGMVYNFMTVPFISTIFM